MSPRGALHGHRTAVTCVASTARAVGDVAVSCGLEAAVIFWRLPKANHTGAGKMLARRQLPQSNGRCNASCVAVSGAGELAAVGCGNQVRLRGVRRGSGGGQKGVRRERPRRRT
eukprot:1195712-Prorocentrum_minimum.AAC.6